jgi:hypothetical protein
MIEHAIPGRMRLRFCARRGETAFFARLAARLQAHPDVRRVIANPRTGSLLVLHAGNSREIAALAGIEVKDAADAPLPARRQSAAKLQSVTLAALALLQLARGRVLDGASQHLWHAVRARELNMPALALGLVGLGIAQGVRGRLLASAASLFMNAVMAQAGRPGGARRMGLRAARFARVRPHRRVGKVPLAH